MNERTDQDLLREYSQSGSEAAFAALVRRHVDLVYSAARRMVCETSLAEDVTQAVFAALAQGAAALQDRAVLSGWLHRTTRNIAAQTVRTEVRRRTRESAAATMNLLASSGSEVPWEELAPELDAALDELSAPDRDAVLLRFFERKSAREVGERLGVGAEAAQKRLNRAVERLRVILARRGLTIGASGLAACLMAHAVQGAPASLSGSIVAAVALGQGATGASITAGIGQAAWWASPKALAATAVVIASVVAPALFERRARAHLTAQEAVLRDQAAALARLEAENARLTALIARTKAPVAPEARDLELERQRLRGQVGLLNRHVQELQRAARSDAATNSLAAAQQVWAERAEQLRQWLDATPSARIPELDLLTEQDWIEAVYPHTLGNEEEYRQAISLARANAEMRVMAQLHAALRAFARASGGEFPSQLQQLHPHLPAPVDDAVLSRYEIVRAATLVNELRPGGEWVITQKTPVDEQWDVRMAIDQSTGVSADVRVTNRWSFVH